jgi:hypothetical protein
VECVTGDMFAIGSLVKVPPEHNTLCMHMGTVVQPQVNIAQCAPTYHILSKLGQRGSGSHVHSTCVLRAQRRLHQEKVGSIGHTQNTSDARALHQSL